jgi:EmrB/QacA subfamily drug resistance transporter
MRTSHPGPASRPNDKQHETPQRERLRMLVFVVCLAQFMVILDVSIVKVALPAIRSGLRFSTTGLQWVVNAYTLTFAGLLLLGGRAADLLGRRQVFLAGTAAFALASLACAVSGSQTELIIARAVQGIAGAAVSPATLSLIAAAIPAGSERNRALGRWGAMAALGASSGALLGGVMTQAFGWRAIFIVNLPLGAVIVTLALRAIPATPARGGERRFDVAGATLITAALVGVTYGIVRTNALGWNSPGVLAPLLSGVALLAAFVLVEARFARVPLLPLRVFRVAQLRAANLIVVLLYSAFFPLFFFLTLYMQQVLGYSAIRAGLGFLPITLSIFTASSLAPRLVLRLGARPVLTAGMLSTAAGMLLLTGITPGGSYAVSILPGGWLVAVGMGLALVTSTIMAMQGVDPADSGLASGLVNTSRLMGGALGLAVLSTIAAATTRGDAFGGVRALTDGFGAAFELGAVFALLGAVAALTLIRRPRASGAASYLGRSRNHRQVRARIRPPDDAGMPVRT